MNNEHLKQVARDNWYLLVALAAVAVAIVYRAASGGEPAPEADTRAATASASRSANAVAATPEVDIAAQERERERALTMSKIRANEEALAANPAPDVAAAYVNGNGNMYFQRLQDYTAAAGNYERVISDYPDSPAIYQTYVNLAMCYEKLNDVEKRKATLRRMLEAFPEDSQQYAYAHLELYGEMPEVVAPPADSSEVETAAEQQPISVASAR